LRYLHPFDLSKVAVVLCDADGNLFPSEEPAFAASATVTNRFLRHLGVSATYSAEELRTSTTGKNFRTTAVDLAVAWGVPVESTLVDGRPNAIVSPPPPGDGAMLTAEALEFWVTEEREAVTAHLGNVLRPDPAVLGPMFDLHRKFGLAAVSSSALVRLAACFSATGLDHSIPAEVRFSAEDSLPVPTSKPDPAIYRLALERLKVSRDKAVAIEDSVPGVASAVAAGIATIGNLMFVPPIERVNRCAELAAAGACAVADCWEEIATAMTRSVDGSSPARL
jgi:beta-phosphoglucomutase-like phosphatase (HAD superfamily)